MLKSVYAADQVRKYLMQAGGPVKIRELVDKASDLTDDGDPRWIGVAVSRFDGAGQLRHSCIGPNHNHTDECTVRWVSA